jgi:hypothetical protein
MENQERESADKERTDGDPRPVPRKNVESPQAFYKRITKREDVRWLLKKLAER